MTPLYHTPPSNFLFWQPKTDYLKKILSHEYGNMLMVILNYSIWYYLIFLYYLVVSRAVWVFWPMMLAYWIGDLIEKYGKKYQLWRRPLFNRQEQPPAGLVKKWYCTGSFPSGHTIKAVCFWLYALEFQVINPIFNLGVILFLLVFRILVGFHYPIDLLGGALVGWLIWLSTHRLVFPPIFNEIIQLLYRSIFPG